MAGFGPKEFKILEKMFPDGFFIIHGCPNGMFQYAKWNPRRTELLELWENWMVEAIKEKGPDFLKGFITKEEIPDYPPEDWT